MLENPNALDKHIQRFSASANLTINYDYPTLENEHDKTLTEIHAFISRMSAAAAPGAHLVELLPWMIHIPERYTSISYIVCLITYQIDARFAKWKREAMGHFRQHSAMFNKLLDTVSNDIVSRYFPDAPNILESLSFQAKGSERPSVCASLLKNSSRNGLSNTEIAWLLGTL